VLGNLDAKRDWGHARDYVRAMWLMLQQETPEDFVIATGETRSVRDFCDLALGCVGVDDAGHIDVDPRFMRPAEVDILAGNAAKAKQKLGWQPTIGFEDLVKE